MKSNEWLKLILGIISYGFIISFIVTYIYEYKDYFFTKGKKNEHRNIK